MSIKSFSFSFIFYKYYPLVGEETKSVLLPEFTTLGVITGVLIFELAVDGLINNFLYYYYLKISYLVLSTGVSVELSN